jgi:hypothetical protein
MSQNTSVLGQSGTAIEILAADDCPLGSAESAVARFYDEPVTYIRNPKPSGGRPAIVHNLAWPQASGTFLHFLDDDVLVPEGLYQAVIHAFSCTPIVGVVFGLIAPVGSDETRLAHEVDFYARIFRRFGAHFISVSRFITGSSRLSATAPTRRRWLRKVPEKCWPSTERTGVISNFTG